MKFTTIFFQFLHDKKTCHCSLIYHKSCSYIVSNRVDKHIDTTNGWLSTYHHHTDRSSDYAAHYMKPLLLFIPVLPYCTSRTRMLETRRITRFDESCVDSTSHNHLLSTPLLATPSTTAKIVSTISVFCSSILIILV